MSLNVITVAELKAKHDSDNSIELIDVRTPAEYSAVHVEFAENFPLDQLDITAIQQSRHSPDQPLYVICKMGVVAQRHVKSLSKRALKMSSTFRVAPMPGLTPDMTLFEA